jgi:transcriptional regulator with XRE-family HTH domain
MERVTGVSSPYFSNELLYRALDAERRRRRTDWAKMAREMGVTRDLLNRIAYDKSKPNLDNVVQILHWLGQWDMSKFCIDPNGLRVEDDGRITIGRIDA